MPVMSGEPYFCDRTMCYSAEKLLNRAYEPVSGPGSIRFSTFHFDDAVHACWSRSDPLSMQVLVEQNEAALQPLLAVRHYARCLLSSRLFTPLFNLSPTSCEGLVIYPRDAAIVIVSLRAQEVWKVAKYDCAVPQIIQNEIVVNSCGASFVPRLLDWEMPGNGNPGYVLRRYVKNVRPVTWGQWPAVLSELLQPLFELYEAMGVTVTPAQQYLELLDSERRALLTECSSPLVSFAGSLLEILFTAAHTLLATLGQVRVSRVFAHGDFSPVNARRTGPAIQMIDWGNSGWHNCLYDLFMQELFHQPSEFWPRFPNCSFADYEQAFHGWALAFLPAIEELLDCRFTAAELNFNLVCCCIEKVLQSAQRYRVKFEARGFESLSKVQRVLAQSALHCARPA
jgi:hypothetical protein